VTDIEMAKARLIKNILLKSRRKLICSSVVLENKESKEK
jgi:hypothetical protein